MLVLSRKVQEQIRIGDNITITVVKVAGNTVRVGIEAPRSVRVLRGEVAPHDESVRSAGRDTVQRDTVQRDEPTMSSETSPREMVAPKSAPAPLSESAPQTAAVSQGEINSQSDLKDGDETETEPPASVGDRGHDTGGRAPVQQSPGPIRPFLVDRRGDRRQVPGRGPLSRRIISGVLTVESV